MPKSKPSKMNWDLSTYFPQFNGKEMKKFKEKLDKDITLLIKKASSLSILSFNSIKAWEKIILKSEEIMSRLSHLDSYVGCLSSTDSQNEDYQLWEGYLSRAGAEFAKARVEILRGIKNSPDVIFKAFINIKSLQNIQHFLNRLRKLSQISMTPEKEILAADLSVDGINAWGRLYDIISGKLEFDMIYPDGHLERKPMSQRRSLMDDSDRRIRKAAFEGGNAAWQSVEDVAAAALNAISGTRHTLNHHRNINHFLDVALFQSSISRKTLDAMFEAVYNYIEIPRRILRLKAKTMKKKGIAWYDLSAPLPIPHHKSISWKQGKLLVKNSFARSYPALADYLQMAYDKDWIEWEPRKGKRPGAFCTGSLLTKEARVFMTFNGTMGDVRTLAHEVGHAFHGYLMRDLRTYAHLYPMTLAETASTFGEMILMDGALEDKELTDTQKASILDMDISHAAIYLMDIPVRFEFEKKLYEERTKGELTVSQLKELMVTTQRKVFANVLEKGGEDPFLWASKLHFYITGVTFYNFPYTFGFLLSRGLYAMFKEEGPAFLQRYENFLRLTGSDTAENVVKRTIGCDLTKSHFWIQSIKSLESSYSSLIKLLPKIHIKQ